MLYIYMKKHQILMYYKTKDFILKYFLNNIDIFEYNKFSLIKWLFLKKFKINSF
jgi:hypothetical protein